MFEIRTDRRKYTIKDEDGEVYFNICMQALFQTEMNVEVYEIDQKVSEPAEIPTNRGGICVVEEEKEEEEAETLTMEALLDAQKKFSEYGKTYHPIDYEAAYKAAEELAENAEKKRRKAFKGFVHIECEHCGQITSTCLKRWQTEFICNGCHEKTPMTDGNMRRVDMYCKCGTAVSYYTNRVDGMFDIDCINCGAPVTVEWNNKKKMYRSL